MTIRIQPGQSPRPALPPTLAACEFIGWIRSRGYPWKAVVGADSYDVAWTRLLDLHGGVSCDRVVLRREKRP